MPTTHTACFRAGCGVADNTFQATLIIRSSRSDRRNRTGFSTQAPALMADTRAAPASPESPTATARPSPVIRTPKPSPNAIQGSNDADLKAPESGTKSSERFLEHPNPRKAIKQSEKHAIHNRERADRRDFTLRYVECAIIMAHGMTE